MDGVIEVLRDRRSFRSVDEVCYHDALADPLKIFRKLADAGWPIDPDKAAAVPSHSKARFINA